MAELTAAMKAQDKVRLEALRYVLALMKNAEIDKHAELTDEELVKLVGSEVKKRKEALRLPSIALRASAQGKLGEKVRQWVDEEEAKLKVLMEWLPEQMSQAEIEKIVDEVMAGGGSDFGSAMRAVMGRGAGRADGRQGAEAGKRESG